MLPQRGPVPKLAANKSPDAELIDPLVAVSPHLQSRLDDAKELDIDDTPTTDLSRAELLCRTANDVERLIECSKTTKVRATSLKEA